MLLPIVVTVPPTSIKGIRKFFMSLTSQGVRFDSVVLSLKIEKDKSKGGIEYSKVKAGVIQRLDKETAGKIKAYADQIRSVMEEAALNNPE
jgi:hypothetical protein